MEHEYHGCHDKTMFSWNEKDSEIKESIDLGSIVLDFDENGRLAGFEIYQNAKEVVAEEFLEKGSCSEPESIEISTED